MTEPIEHGGPRIGLCGWTINRAEYLRHFPVVEIQHTFYEPPTDALLAKWRADVPKRFEFTMKAWQLITHESSSPTYRRLKQPLPHSHSGHVGAFRATIPVLHAWERTLECARVLSATAVLLQCPKSFTPTATHVKQMRTFLETVERPASSSLLWEPRGEWPTSLLIELCDEHDLVHVVDPMQTETVTPERTYYRLHGTTGMRHVHTYAELREVHDRIVYRRLRT